MKCFNGQLQPADTYVDTTNQCNRFTQRTVIPLTRAGSMLNQEACSSLESKTRIGVLVDVDINRVLVTGIANQSIALLIERVDRRI